MLFNCETNDAYSVKVLTEVLSTNVRIGCFVIDETGMKLVMIDAQKKVLFDVVLHADKFTSYHFDAPQKLHIGVNLTHLYKTLKSAKKKDILRLCINKNSPGDLIVIISSNENHRTVETCLKIQAVQNLDIELPEHGAPAVEICANDFAKMLKDLATLGTTLTINAKKSSVQFMNTTGQIFTRKICIGNDKPDEIVTYSCEFYIDTLLRVIKISGLNTHMTVIPANPLVLAIGIGTFGDMKIFVKNKEQVDAL